LYANSIANEGCLAREPIGIADRRRFDALARSAGTLQASDMLKALSGLDEGLAGRSGHRIVTGLDLLEDLIASRLGQGASDAHKPRIC